MSEQTKIDWTDEKWRELAEHLATIDYPPAQFCEFIERTGLPFFGIFAPEVFDQANAETVTKWHEFTAHWNAVLFPQ